MQNDFIKITHAVYQLLDVLPDSEPLKLKAKEKALSVLENLSVISHESGWMSLKKYLAPEREKIAGKAVEDIAILESYLGLAKQQGWIQGMNLLIVLKEYQAIKNRLQPMAIIVERVAQKPVELPKDLPAVEAGTIPAIVPAKPVVVKQKETLPPENLSPRQGKILEILKKRQQGQVADFIKELPKITKRTIRRDLDDLLKKGRIIRAGQWNQVTYRIFDRTK